MYSRIIIFCSILGLFSSRLGAQERFQLQIEITGIRNENGFVSIALFKGAEGFPEEKEKAYILDIATIKEGKAVFVFKDLSEGEYAFAILHDENKNGEIEKNVFGIPKEGFALSQNFKPKLVPPTFRETSFKIENCDLKQSIEMIYYL